MSFDFKGETQREKWFQIKKETSQLMYIPNDIGYQFNLNR